MSPAQNPNPQSSKPASSPQPRTKDPANSAPEPSSPAEPMTDPTSNSLLAKPPTRIKPADAAQPNPAKPDPAKPDPAKSDPAKSDPAKPDPAKSDAVQPDVAPDATTSEVATEVTKPEVVQPDTASSDSDGIEQIEQTPKLAAKPNAAKLEPTVQSTVAAKSSSTKSTAAKPDAVKRDAKPEQNPPLEVATKLDDAVEAVTPEVAVSAPAEMVSSAASSETLPEGVPGSSLEVESVLAPEVDASSGVDEVTPEEAEPAALVEAEVAVAAELAVLVAAEVAVAAEVEVEVEAPTEAPATEVPATEVPATEVPATEVPKERSEIEALLTQTPPIQTSPRQQPIPPASEPMQYRAIGLVRGKYMPSEEQFTRGFILTDDEVLIDAVLLGRVMSLVKKHIDLEQSHLWVVYPRTRERDLQLHMQIVGIWEPEKLNRSLDMETAELDVAELDATEEEDEVIEDFQPQAEPESEPHEPEAEAVEADATDESLLFSEELDDRYFSVRGEIVYQADDEQRLLVKIRRSPKPGESEGKSFKVALRGALAGKALGYFWDLQVKRQSNELVVQEASQIGMVPPQKRSASDRDRPRRSFGGPRRGGGPGAGGPPRKRWDGGSRDEGRRPSRSDRPTRPVVDRPSVSSTPRQPISKPIKRRPKEDES